MPRSAYPLNCAGQTAFVDPAFQCPPGYEEVQRPEEPPNSIHIAQRPGSLSIDYYWKSVLSIPTACNNRSTFEASTSVEFTTGLEAALEGKMGSVTLSHEVKTSNTLGFQIEFGEDSHIYQATLYQLHAYIHFYSLVTPGALGRIEFALATLAWELGINFSTSDCEEQDLPLNRFQLHACRKYCGPENERARR